MEKLKSEGKCLFCDKTFAKAGMSKHLKKHLELMPVDTKRLSYLLKVETPKKWGASPYFLYLWVSNKATINDVDNFLRSIWLECCGHLSSFKDVANKPRRVGMFSFFEEMELEEQDKTKELERYRADMYGEIAMNKKVSTVFYQNQVLEYEYDFGSTTKLMITVIDVIPTVNDIKITLLSRNEPPEIMCETCKKEPATNICIAHGWDEDSLFCPKCAKKHAKECDDFTDYADMPVVNSPRMGVCAYDGGKIDKERDGIFKRN